MLIRCALGAALVFALTLAPAAANLMLTGIGSSGSGGGGGGGTNSYNFSIAGNSQYLPQAF